jgi:glycosyltransferase involved in cell wall biosynthesis
MKVCHVINTLNRGGAEAHLFDLVHQQTLKSYEVSLIVIGSDRDNIMSLEEDFNNLQIRIKRLNGPRMFNISSYFRLHSHIKRNKYQIIHSHQPRSDFMLYVVRKFYASFRWIISVHGKYDTYLESTKISNSIKKRFMHLLARYWEKADAIIAISDAVSEWIVDLNKKIRPTTIPYWVEQSNLNSTNTFGEDISVGFLGRLNKNKGIEELLSAFNKLDTTNLTLTIGGYSEPTYLEYLKSISNEESSKKIKYLGYVSNRKTFYDSIDLLVFPSFSEGLGLVLLEAMSFSKVCITRDILPMNTYLTKDSGYLFKNNEELLISLNEAIQDLRGDNKKIKSKLFNIEQMVKRCSAEIIFPMIEKVYQSE